MSITRTESFPCPCGELLIVQLADSLNAVRHPFLRDDVIARRLHAVTCAACSRTIVVEHDFLYVDLERRQVFGVFSRGARADADTHARRLQETFERWFCTDAPLFIRQLAEHCLVRACFGLEELREKLVADDAGLDDCRLEALKCVLLLQDPRYREALVATLRLERIHDGMLDLLAVDINDQPLGDIVRVPREELDRLPLAAIRAALPGLAAGPHVSMLRLVPYARP